MLEAAYNDSQGVTAEFNRNLLHRANRELHDNFDLAHWQHRAVYNAAEGRIEMNLISQRDQTVRLEGQSFPFEAGERIVTEYSYKHTPEGFADMAASAGVELDKMCTDDRRLFGAFYFTLPG